MTDSTVGATPGQDLSGLLQPNLNTPDLLNLAEAEAIDRAAAEHIDHARKKKRNSGWLTDSFIRKVHHDMFGTIWEWAGRYRTVPVNLGVEPHRILEQIHILCGDFNEEWDLPNSLMPVLEVAARLQQRLTKIHPFKDGNGRHARLITDIFLHSRDHPLPKWPQIHRLRQGDAIRGAYVAALKTADDHGDYTALTDLFKDWLNEKQ